MVGSIDPRCETVRGIHWPKKGREVVWSSRRGNHLGQRPKATASTGRTYGCKRSDQTLKKLLWHGGRPHMARGPSTYGSLLSQGRREPTSSPQAPKARIRRRRNRSSRSWSVVPRPSSAAGRKCAGRIAARFPRRQG